MTLDSLTSQLEVLKKTKIKGTNSSNEPLKEKIEEVEDVNYDIRSQLAHKERQLTELEKRYKESLNNAQNIQASESREKERLLHTLRDESARMRSNYQGLLNAISEKDQKIQQFERH
ncbi:unnamed protein product [Rhizophagus irregularis]|nr:unnamed protein product [Rhizophagus irregularis]